MTSDADQRQLILGAVSGASSAWPNAVRVLADFGHRASQHHLVLRQRPDVRLPVMSLLWAFALPASRSFRAPSRPTLSAASGALFAQSKNVRRLCISGVQRARRKGLLGLMEDEGRGQPGDSRQQRNAVVVPAT